MKNQNLTNAKKLSKKQLRTIAGGLLNCMEPVLCTNPPCDPPSDPNGCTMYSPKCAQRECRVPIEIIP
ncbi:MAG: hypothetical protein LBE92_12270 [Chryseobacterium sp.]|jgi:hypothetical protein|uniref:hypothetical protein n=1 Tax=Chryseobacterium sp. TaxID=1871047 RepID=UPI0028325549|nr:hypothetical protein [Chryseobacterium sp.]MDR2236891.1 hypothetical protein [Chryseobacterium sp.]